MGPLCSQCSKTHVKMSELQIDEPKILNGNNSGSERRKTLDANRYATKKTIAQGMLDVALLTANASQLKYVLQVGEDHAFYTLMLTLIIISIILQVVVGVALLIIGPLDFRKKYGERPAYILNE